MCGVRAPAHFITRWGGGGGGGGRGEVHGVFHEAFPYSLASASAQTTPASVGGVWARD